MASVVGDRKGNPETLLVVGEATLDHHAAGADVDAHWRFAVGHPGRFVEQIDVFLQRQQGQGECGRRTPNDEQHHREPPLAELSHLSISTSLKAPYRSA